MNLMATEFHPSLSVVVPTVAEQLHVNPDISNVLCEVSPPTQSVFEALKFQVCIAPEVSMNTLLN